MSFRRSTWIFFQRLPLIFLLLSLPSPFFPAGNDNDIASSSSASSSSSHSVDSPTLDLVRPSRHKPPAFLVAASPLTFMREEGDQGAATTTTTTTTNITTTTGRDLPAVRKQSIYDAYFVGEEGKFRRFSDRLYQGLDMNSDGSLQQQELNQGIDEAKKNGALPNRWNVTITALDQDGTF